MWGDYMIDGKALGDVGYKYLGTPYSVMDCQKFYEKCLSDLGFNLDLAGSNAWYRYIMEHGRVLTPEECVKELGCVPKGATLFIHAYDGGEEKRGYHDGLGNASHIGICTMPRGEGAIASSASRGCVAESKFKGKSIKGGWNMVGLPNFVMFDYGGDSYEPNPSVWRPTIRKGSKGEDVKFCQQLLLDNGYDVGPSGIDGDYGRKTEEAVKKFQKANGLVEDGVVGPMTWSKLMEDDPAPREFYTVTIRHVTFDEVVAFQQVYDDVEVKEENG